MPNSFEHRWLPAENYAQARTILLLHGTAGDENDLISMGQFLDPKANFLSPRGRVDENGANRFFRRFSEGVYDLENMREETEALGAFLQASAETYGFDPTHVYAVGFSNGANIAVSLLFRQPELLAGAFLMRATVPFEPETPPALSGTRILLASGETDPLVPRDTAKLLAFLFVQAGADVEHLWVPGGHNLTRPELDHAKKWFTGLV